MIKASSLGLELATAGEKCRDTRLEKIRAVRCPPTEAADDTATAEKPLLRLSHFCNAGIMESRETWGGNGDAQSNLKERPFKSVDTFKKLHGIQNQTGKGNYLVWPAVRHLEVKMSSWHGLDKPFPKTRPRCFVQQIKGTVLCWPCRHNTVSGTGHNPGTSSEQNPLQPNPDKSHALQLTE